MVRIYVDNQPYEADASRSLLDACLSLGFNIPYFCWHPAMGSVGACRQCAVKMFKSEKDMHGKIVMSCLTPVTEGLRISIDDPEVKEFRASVIEWLMINHPHDCPVCDEGGECHLQDMTVMTGHVYRRYRFSKRTYENQYLGPLVNHEMNRCIQCYRCLRFYRDYAGGRDFDVFGAHDGIFFGREKSGVLESEFSGNLVEVCPTGVFTDKTLGRHYTRKWDMQNAPSICVHCGLGCNTIPGERYGELRRIHNRYNGQVNAYFLCDRGRYGYEFVNSSDRIRQPLLGGKGGLRATTKEEALRRAAELLRPMEKVIGIGSPRASLESNFALRTMVGPERFHLGISANEYGLLSAMLEILMSGPTHSPSLEEIRASDAVLILGEDVTNTAPVMALALRQSVRRAPMQIVRKLKIPEWLDSAVRDALHGSKGPFYIVTPYATKLDEIATQTWRGAPDDVARLGFAVAHELGGGAPAVPNLSREMAELAGQIAQALKGAQKPLVVSGTGCGSEEVVQAAASVAWALGALGRPAQLSFAMPECNSLGLMMMGGNDLVGAFRAVREGAAETVVILENDLYRRAPAAEVEALLGRARHVIVLDCLMSPTMSRAELVLPAGSFAEADGTLVNSEGRAQRFYQVFVPHDEQLKPQPIMESWRWLRDVMVAAGRSEEKGWHNLDDVCAALTKAMTGFRPILRDAPHAGFREFGQKIPREPHRYSGRTAMHANIKVVEPKPPDDPDTPLAFSMEGYPGQPPPPLIPYYWAPGWNSAQALNKYQSEVGGPLRGGDPGVRLIELLKGAKPVFSGQVPEPFKPRPGEWLFVPIHHIFGSEELSNHSRGIGELAPEPYVGLGEEDAAALSAHAGDLVEVNVGGAAYRLALHISTGLPRGVAGLPTNVAGLQTVALPIWGRITKGGR